MRSILADLFSPYASLQDYNPPPGGGALPVAVFLVLLCCGVAAHVALLLYLIKRPATPRNALLQMSARAMDPLPFSGLLAGIVFFYLLASLVHSAFYGGIGLGPHTLILQVLLFHLPVLGLLAFLLRQLHVHWSAFSGWQVLRTWKAAGLGLACYLAILPPLWFYSVLYQLFLHRSGYGLPLQDSVQILMDPASPWMRALLCTIAVVAAPVFEEIVFRGLLFPFAARRMGLLKAGALISILFAAMHWHLPSFGPLFLLSAALCAAYAFTGSLTVPVVMHALFNGITVLLILLS